MLPSSLFYFARGYVETSYGGQAIFDASAFAVLLRQRLRRNQLRRTGDIRYSMSRDENARDEMGNVRYETQKRKFYFLFFTF